MSWLISLVLAGVVFSSDTTVPFRQNYTNSETTAATRVVRLDETERFEQTYPLNANGRVSISNVNGSITIDTWDRNEVKLEAVKTADDKDRLSEVEIKIDARKDSITIETNYDNWNRNNGSGWKRNNGNLTVDYRLTVPRNAVLDEIETVNGSVNISNSNNVTKASTVNGQLVATNLRGAAELSTVNGTIEATFDQLQSSSRINLETVNGQVNLVIPSDANATVKADTLNGPITNDFGLPVRKGEYVGRDLYGRIGSGEVQIKLNSVNGGLHIKRKNDGKSVNPATNLLPAKNKNDDNDVDVDVDVDAKVDLEKMNREMRQAQRDLQRAQREMAKVKPPIVTIDKEKIQAQVREDLRRQAETMRLADVNFFSGAPVIEKKSESFSVKGTPKVFIDAKSCEVSVRGWDKPEVQYAITRISRARNQKAIVYDVNRSDSEVKITVSGAKDAQNREIYNDPERVRVEVFVPKKSNLRILSNREIRLENVSGEIDLTGSDEAVNVRNVDGKLTVAARDGKIRVIGFAGEIEARTAGGDLSLEGEFEKITATTGSGNIIVTVADNVSAIIRANTDSVKLDGNLPSKVKTEDVSEKSSVWRIGDSRAEYNFNVGDGQIFIRSMNDLKAAL